MSDFQPGAPDKPYGNFTGITRFFYFLQQGFVVKVSQWITETQFELEMKNSPKLLLKYVFFYIYTIVVTFVWK